MANVSGKEDFLFFFSGRGQKKLTIGKVAGFELAPNNCLVSSFAQFFPDGMWQTKTPASFVVRGYIGDGVRLVW